MAESTNRLSEKKLMEIFWKNKFPNLSGKFKLSRIEDIIQDSPDIKENLPEDYVLNPITGTIVTFCPKRKTRENDVGNNALPAEKPSCKICDGNTTPILLYKPFKNNDGLGDIQQFAFVNLNKYPVIRPTMMKNINTGEYDIYGYQLLIWPTTEHKPLFKLDAEEHINSLELMKTLENLLEPRENLLVTRNLGELCGNSIEHEHYQAFISNFLPRRLREESEYFQKNGFSLVEHLDKTLRDGRGTEKIGDFDSFDVIVPYYARRGLESMIVPSCTRRERITDLEEDELYDLSRAILSVTKKLSEVMPAQKKKYSYNLVFHTGNIGTMYVEVLPYMQAEAGLEKAGMDVSQMTPIQSKEVIGDMNDNLIGSRCPKCGRHKAYVARTEDRAFSIHYINETDIMACPQCGNEWEGASAGNCLA